MKLQLPATTAVPAGLAAASIALALLLLPGGATSVRSAGVAPALRLVAGDVAAVVQSPAPSVTKTQPKSVASTPASVPPTSAGTHQTSASVRAPTVPAHKVQAARTAVSRGSVPPKHVVNSTSVKTPVPAAPRVIAQPVKHGQGKAKALGHLKKGKAKAVGHRRKIAPHASSNAASHAVTASHGHGPPAVPPGQAKGSKTEGGNGTATGRGGGK